MRLPLPLSLALFLVALCSPRPAFAQSTATVTVSALGDGRVAEWMYGEHIPAVPGLPFSAKVELELVNQLQDGTLITHKTYNVDARDSLGRTRNEGRNWINPSTGEEPRLIRIELYDPSTRTRTNLFPLTKIARQWIVAPAAPITTAAALNTSIKPETSRENIGTDTIEGLPVRGVHVNQTYAPGVLGNDRPLIIVTEYWYSEVLEINLLTKRTDPRFGVQTVRVTELVRQEPDAALFAIPDEYKLVKETVQDPQSHGYGSGAPEEGASTGFAGSSGSGSPLTGIARAGVGGVTSPLCIYCPTPSYSENARTAKVSGTVILSVVVTADGLAENAQIVRGPGYGLEQKAIEAVRKWRFRPATGPDGKPVACVVMIEVAFKLG
jgi:TonB family protein